MNRSQRHGFRGLSAHTEPRRPDHRPVHDEARAQRLKAIEREHEVCATCTHLQCRAGTCPLEGDK